MFVCLCASTIYRTRCINLIKQYRRVRFLGTYCEISLVEKQETIRMSSLYS